MGPGVLEGFTQCSCSTLGFQESLLTCGTEGPTHALAPSPVVVGLSLGAGLVVGDKGFSVVLVLSQAQTGPVPLSLGTGSGSCLYLLL